MRISGFGHLPDEVLPDELYERQRMLVSTDVAARYGCLASLAPEMGPEESFAAYYPPNCAWVYQYYVLSLDGGPGRVADVQGQFAEASTRLTEFLPQYVRENAGYYYVAEDRADLDEAVEQTTRPTITIMVVFGIVAATATSSSSPSSCAWAPSRSVGTADVARAGRDAPEKPGCRCRAAVGDGGGARHGSDRRVVAVAARPRGHRPIRRPITRLRLRRARGIPRPGPVRVRSRRDDLAARRPLVPIARELITQRGGRAPPSRRTTEQPPRGVRRCPGVDRPRPGRREPRRVPRSRVAVTVGVAALVFGSNVSELVNEPQRYGGPGTSR